MIKFKKEYVKFIEQKGVGLKDHVASSVDSYVSYLNSVSGILKKDITPEFLNSEDDVDRFVLMLKGQKADKTVSNYRSAMRQYVNMVMALNLK